MGGRTSSSGMSKPSTDSSVDVSKLDDFYADNPHIKKTPFPVDEKSYSLIVEEKWKKRVKSDLGVRTLELSQLTAAQPAVLTRDLNDILSGGFDVNKAGSISVLYTRGKYIIVDGTHRATAAKLSGHTSIKAHIYSTEGVK